jgi:hypothetical protein
MQLIHAETKSIRNVFCGNAVTRTGTDTGKKIHDISSREPVRRFEEDHPQLAEGRADSEPARHPITKYRLWTDTDIAMIRRMLDKEAYDPAGNR